LPPAAVRLAPWQFWNQLDDPAQDGDTSGPNGSGPNAYNDCGPESDAEILWHLTNVTLDADYIWDCIQQRRALSGQTTGPGYTSTQDHIDFFTSVAGTPCRELSVDPSLSFASAEVQSFISAIKRALAHGHPLLGLFSYSAPNAPDGHFRAILGYNRDHIITGDPLRSGAARVESLTSFWAWSRGWALEIQRKRAIAE
jgi:hypothetical protein